MDDGEPVGPVVEVTDLRMRYGDKDVLTGVDFTVDEGEVVCLLGPNGAGKTTTIEILEGFRERSAGAVTVLGQDPAGPPRPGAPARASSCSRGATTPRWTPSAPARPDGRLLRAVRRRRSGLVRYRPTSCSTSSGSTELADQRIATFSGGQRRRLDVAIGIVGRPDLLFLDEPTAGFDPQARREFHHLVHRLADLEHTTILLTTHDLDEAEKLADRVLILAGGRIVADDTAEQLALRAAIDVEVKWSRGGERFVHATRRRHRRSCTGCSTSTGAAVVDLEVRRASLEDAYLALVQRHESGQSDAAARAFTEAI